MELNRGAETGTEGRREDGKETNLATIQSSSKDVGRAQPAKAGAFGKARKLGGLRGAGFVGRSGLTGTTPDCPVPVRGDVTHRTSWSHTSRSGLF